VIQSNINKTQIDPHLIFKNYNTLGHYYSYYGSMSQPPCIEDTIRLIYPTIFTISQEQLDFFDNKWKNNPNFAMGNGNNRKIKEKGIREVIYNKGENYY